MIAAQDETYRDAKNIHSKYIRHQAFESEIAANKDRLAKIEEEGTELMRQKPSTSPDVEPKLEELRRQWEDLENTTKNKGQKLFDANRCLLLLNLQNLLHRYLYQERLNTGKLFMTL